MAELTKKQTQGESPILDEKEEMSDFGGKKMTKKPKKLKKRNLEMQCYDIQEHKTETKQKTTNDVMAENLYDACEAGKHFCLYLSSSLCH